MAAPKPSTTTFLLPLLRAPPQSPRFTRDNSATDEALGILHNSTSPRVHTLTLLSALSPADDPIVGQVS